jgi:hypothetical protein
LLGREFVPVHDLNVINDIFALDIAQLGHLGFESVGNVIKARPAEDDAYVRHFFG